MRRSRVQLPLVAYIVEKESVNGQVLFYGSMPSVGGDLLNQASLLGVGLFLC